ncbi:hypothetical protein [Streptosporangium sp. NPDC049046]|uniref:hypothetical protein n=1 Tax=unclassified Streptosporangium TaxID=2632669 RepID=UPI00343DE2C9
MTTGRIEAVHAVAVGQVDGQPIALTGGYDKIVRVWDLTTHELLGELANLEPTPSTPSPP